MVGTASLAAYQAAAQAITYENLSDNPSTQPRSLEEKVFDGDVMSNAITITINITPVNDPPQVTGSANDLFYADLRSYTLLSVETASEDMVELVYSINFKKKVSEQNFLNAIKEIEGCKQVSLVTGLQNINI